MPFDSRKQQQWYHATDQTYLDDESPEARKVKGKEEEPEFKDLTKETWIHKIETYRQLKVA